MASQTHVERFALGFTKWIGSAASIIAHTIAFALCFYLSIVGMVPWDTMLLVLTTVVSLEAIYLAIFIQMSLNYTTEDIVEIQEDIDDIQEDVEEISEDVDELQEDVEEISEDVEELNEDDESEEEAEERHNQEQAKTLETIKTDLQKLIADVERLRGEAK